MKISHFFPTESYNFIEVRNYNFFKHKTCNIRKQYSSKTDTVLNTLGI